MQKDHNGLIDPEFWYQVKGHVNVLHSKKFEMNKDAYLILTENICN